MSEETDDFESGIEGSQMAAEVGATEQFPKFEDDWGQIRGAIIDRDNHRCTNCTKPDWAVEAFHVDHIVPRGCGGSDRFENLHTLCEQCHMAKHGDGLTPMLEFRKSRWMNEYTFRYWEQFWKEMLPAMGRSIGVRLDPKFNLDGHNLWRVSLGNLRLADAKLSMADEEYGALRAASYM
jgi:hypothetical protein